MSSSIIARLAGEEPLAAKGTESGEKPGDSRPPVIAAQKVRLAYGRNVVLEDVNLEIREGEFWCFLGPNGEGKSTFLKAVLGAVKPAKGAISLRRDFGRRTRLAFVPQESEINNALPTTVREFIEGGLVGLKLDHKTSNSRCEQVMEMLGLKPRKYHDFWTLSGGLRQRCLLARALVRDPLLLIVDEPTAGLDLAASTGLLEIITNLNREKGITVGFVTHQLEIAAERASHVALFKGRKVTSGPVTETFTEENLEQTFGIPLTVKHGESGRITVGPRAQKVSHS